MNPGATMVLATLFIVAAGCAANGTARPDTGTTAVATTTAPVASDSTNDSTVRRGIIVDGPVYESIEQLTAESEVAVVGQFDAIVDRVVDRGGEDGNPGIPYQLWSFKPSNVLSGEFDPNGVVVLIDGDEITSNHAVSVTPGMNAVLFLTAPNTPLSTASDATLYSPVGGANGILLVDGDTAQTNGYYPSRLTDEATSTTASATQPIGDNTFPLAAVIETVKTFVAAE